MATVSNSEIKYFQACNYQFIFSRTMKLQPRQLPFNIQKGSYGHSLFQVYFRGRQEELDHDQAIDLMTDYHIRAALDINDMDITNVWVEVCSFLDWFATQPVKVLHVETPFKYELEDGNVFAFTPDLVVEYIGGKLKGEVVVLDWKFVGQWWSPRSIKMMQQLPKYAYYLSVLKGYMIKRTALVQINTRKNKSKDADTHRINWNEMSSTKMLRVASENEKWVKHISEFKELPLDEQFAVGTRTVEEKTCAWCWFADDVCPGKMENKKIDIMVKANYLESDYSYDDIPK